MLVSPIMIAYITLFILLEVMLVFLNTEALLKKGTEQARAFEFQRITFPSE